VWPGFSSTGARAKRTWTLPSLGSTSSLVTVIDCLMPLTFRLAPSSFTATALLPYFGIQRVAAAPTPEACSDSVGAVLTLVLATPPAARLSWLRCVGLATARPGLR